jgi:FMN phosphatase YigB (HAD superfamily)
MIRNIVFDFGRVIVDFDETKMTRAFITEEEKVAHVRDVVFDRLYWDKLDLGTITDEEVKAGISSRLSAPLVPLACAVYDHWIENVDILPGIKEAILTAREKAEGLYLLSNISIKFVEEYGKNPAICRLRDFVQSSSNRGVEKYRSAVSGSTVTTVLPGPSFFASFNAAATLVPEEMPTIRPSSFARRQAVSMASASVTT